MLTAVNALAGAAIACGGTRAERFVQVREDFDEWPQALQTLYKLVWKLTGHNENPCLRYTIGQLAEMCDKSRSWVCEAIRLGVERGVWKRWSEYGPRRVAGRILELTVNFFRPNAKPARRATKRVKPAQVAAKADLTAEQAEALARVQAEAKAKAEAELTAEPEAIEPGALRRIFEAELEAAGGALKPRKVSKPAFVKNEAAEAELAAIRAKMPAPGAS